MRGHTEGRELHQVGTGRRQLTSKEFTALMEEARAEARRHRVGRPPTRERDFTLRTQHAEFGAAAH